MKGLVGSREKHVDASSSDAAANGARLGGAVAGVAEAEVAAREEHRRGWTTPAHAARVLELGMARVYVGRLGVLGWRGVSAPARIPLGRRRGGGRGVLELGVE